MNKTRQTDLGTPASKLQEMVQVEIDGLPTTVNAGTSILRAARESGVDIPKLCATDNLKPFGSCRMCLVEIEGRKEQTNEQGSPHGSRHAGIEKYRHRKGRDRRLAGHS